MVTDRCSTLGLLFVLVIDYDDRPLLRLVRKKIRNVNYFIDFSGYSAVLYLLSSAFFLVFLSSSDIHRISVVGH